MYEDHLYRDLTYKIIGVAFTIHKNLGPVHKEIIYQKALAEEFFLLGIPFKREEHLVVTYRDKKIGLYQPDFVVDDKVIIEVKALSSLPTNTNTQLSYYLKGTKYKIGLLLNFGSQSLEIHRRIYDKSRKI